MPTKLHVGNLDKENPIDKGELEDMFKEFGNIADIWVARQPPGFAFITYDDERDAEDAVKALDGKNFHGQDLRVQISTNTKGKAVDVEAGAPAVIAVAVAVIHAPGPGALHAAGAVLQGPGVILGAGAAE
eukprot:CAMPEP_0197631914 /NCGR_PEP_ID=MMETSP1338-20131121/8917_1 /TAXON_ID=43686 ORGANISM="Pelagodinium beii, Strain RCC1491" /NCGR_SAMPLE_ID=MMETSP1338 /ASSEMBLY_ACC=CAM_ASM_000754 /LENGTH=129 /DNA_ID=CAMNT_0043203455 /DNA_START=51 /DNA_END=441 /DNA_ORIENTATION=+